MSRPISPFRRVWGWPLALGLLSASGLLSALVSDAWGDAWSWIGLGVPVAAMAWFAWRPRPSTPKTPDDNNPRGPR
jgi:hypothetical protein